MQCKYYLQTNTGFWFNPLCFSAGTKEHFRLLKLQYNQAGIPLWQEMNAAHNSPYLGGVITRHASDVTDGFPYFAEKPKSRLAGLPEH